MARKLETKRIGLALGLVTNDEKAAGIDHSPGYLRTGAKKLAGG